MNLFEKLIVLEGLDAAGKATQAKKLAERFEAGGYGAVVYSFPRYETTVGKAILRHLKGSIAMREEHTIDSSDHRIDGDTVYHAAAEDPLAFQCMMVADKYDAAPDIVSHLTVGRVVICDRWWQSAVCFGAADGLNRAWLHRVHRQLPQGDYNLYIDVPPEEALRRRPEARDRYERDREKQARVRANYDLMWKGDNKLPGYYGIIDGLGTADEVHARIWAIVRP